MNFHELLQYAQKKVQQGAEVEKDQDQEKENQLKRKRETIESVSLYNKGEKYVRLNFGRDDDENATPRDFLDELEEIYDCEFFDPCPLGGAEMARQNPEKYDGLIIDWQKKNFVNPPFSKIAPWLKKGVEEMQKGRLSVFIIPARVSSVYWRQWVFPYATRIEFLNRSLCFGKHQKPIPTPVAIIEYDPKKKCNNLVLERKTHTAGVIVNTPNQREIELWKTSRFAPPTVLLDASDSKRSKKPRIQE